MDEIADSLIRLKQIEPIIIIAIDNIGMSKRGNEYLPWEDIYLSPPIPNPQGKKYPDFLIHEVMPLIESVYKVKTGRENTGVGGFSYGGLSAAFTVLVRSSNIGLLLAETPSLYVNNKKIFSEFLDSKKQFPLKVYLGVGTNELALSNCNEENEDNKMAVDDLKELGSIIQRKSTTTQVRINIAKCATHSFEEASKRLPVALKFLFPNADNQAH